MSDIKDFINQISLDKRPLFLALAEHASSLGYIPRRSKTQDFIITFNKGKDKILKYGINSRGDVQIYIKFFRATKFSRVFNDAVLKEALHYNGCYGCGKCDGTQGYVVFKADGTRLFRCGSEFITIALSEKDIDEAKLLMTMQSQSPVHE